MPVSMGPARRGWVSNGVAIAIIAALLAQSISPAFAAIGMNKKGLIATTRVGGD